jgi:hypothetical protein
MAIKGREGGTGHRRGGPAWIDERNLERGDMRVVQGFAALRAERVFAEAETCAACRALRSEQGDPEALCEDHLASALGMKSRWT